MKTAALTVALTIGLSALNTLAQEGNAPSRRSGDELRGGELLMGLGGLRLQRQPTEGSHRDNSAEAGPRQRRWGGAGLGPPSVARGRSQESEDTAPMRRGARPQERFGRGAPDIGPKAPSRGFGAGHRGFGPPMMGHRGFQGPADVCPFCGRHLGPVGPQARYGRGGSHFNSSDRGPGFGPRPFGNRGTPPPSHGGFGPRHRGPGGPDAAKDRIEQGGPAPQPERPGPANRPPPARDER